MDSYFKRVDELIDFFETEKEKNTYYFNQFRELGNYYFSTFLSIAAILIALSSRTPDTFLTPYLTLGLLVVIGLAFRYNLDRSDKRYKEHVKRRATYDIIINFLQVLKILEVEADLSPLIDKIKRLYRDMRFFMVKDYDEFWLNEVISSLDIINEEVTNKLKAKEERNNQKSTKKRYYARSRS